MKMDVKGDGDSLEDILAGRTTDYVTTLSTDVAFLSDSDPEDLDILADEEVHVPSRKRKKHGVTLLDGTKPHSLLSSKQKSPVQPFHLKGMSSTFSVRSQSIFDALEGPTSRTTPCPVTAPKENFKRPFPPGALARSPGAGPTQNRPPFAIPDYVAHPERWTEYSLEDVAETSNRKNTMVAQEFLEDMRKRKMNENVVVKTNNYTPVFNQDSSSSATERIVFAKPVKSNLSMEAEDGVKKEAGCVANLGLSKIAAAKWGEEEEEEAGGKVQFAISNAEEDEKQEEKALAVSNVASAPDKDSINQLGFHSNKKRSRKNLRSRVEPVEDEDSS